MKKLVILTMCIASTLFAAAVAAPAYPPPALKGKSGPPTTIEAPPTSQMLETEAPQSQKTTAKQAQKYNKPTQYYK